MRIVALAFTASYGRTGSQQTSYAGSNGNIVSDSDVNVFNMTVEEYNAMKTSENMALRYDVPDGSTVILNIVGEGDVNLVYRSHLEFQVFRSRPVFPVYRSRPVLQAYP